MSVPTSAPIAMKEILDLLGDYIRQQPGMLSLKFNYVDNGVRVWLDIEKLPKPAKALPSEGISHDDK